MRLNRFWKLHTNLFVRLLNKHLNLITKFVFKLSLIQMIWEIYCIYFKETAHDQLRPQVAVLSWKFYIQVQVIILKQNMFFRKKCVNIEYMIEDLLREHHLIFFTKNFLRRLPFESQWPPFSPSVNDNDTTQAVRAMRDIIFRKGYHEHLFVCWLHFRNRKRLVISWEKRITAVCQGYIKT